MSAAQRVALAVAIVFLAGSLGYVIGSRAGDGSAPAASSADVGFLWDMVAHHEQAIVMAQYEIADGAEPRVIKFAREIVQAQSYEIGLMEAYLRRWDEPRYRPDGEPAMTWMGHSMATDEMPGMASEEQLQQLADSSGRDADARFVELMKRHHVGGADMAEAAAKSVDDDAVQQLAARMARFQRVEVKEMEMTRVALGLPVP